MKIFSADHEFDYSWDEVSTANWRKYCPWNKESGHVIAVDTLSRSLDPKTGVLRTERLITCKQNAPKWITAILGGDEMSHVYEVSYVTPPAAKVEAKLEQQTKHEQIEAKGNSVTEAVAQTREKRTQDKGTSVWNRAIWSKPSPTQSPPTQLPPQTKPQSTTSTSSPETLPQPIQRDQDPTITHMPSAPAIHNRPASASPPSTPPANPHMLPSPPSHPAPRSPSITMLSTNLTHSNLISVRETVTYTPSPGASDIHTGRTRFEQNARIESFCGGWAKVREKIEGFTVERFGQNAERGRKGFEGVLEMSRRVFGEEREREEREKARA